MLKCISINPVRWTDGAEEGEEEERRSGFIVDRGWDVNNLGRDN